MELIEFYNRIKNPLNDPDVVNKLISAYGSSEGLSYNFYLQVNRLIGNGVNKTRVNEKDQDKFNSLLFKKWKESILSLAENQVDWLIKNKNVKPNFRKLQALLKNTPDFLTTREINDFIYEKRGDSELEEALEKYHWSDFGSDSGWTHVSSLYVEDYKKEHVIPEHRLYINPEPEDLYKFLNYFISKCMDYNLPYYFKFVKERGRDDSILIYTSTEKIKYYLKVLEEIKEENPDLISRLNSPPILTGKVNKWLGYGSEPEEDSNGKSRSYNEVRTELIELVIDKNTKNWVLKHLNMQVNYQGNPQSFIDYLVRKAVENFIANNIKVLEYHENYERNKARNEGRNYNQENVINKLGFTREDLYSAKFKELLFRNLQQQMSTIITKVCTKGYKDIKNINIPGRNNVEITLTGRAFEKVVRDFAVTINKIDPTFSKNIQKEIIEKCPEYGIDSDKFAFDLKRKDEFIKSGLKEIPKEKKETKRNILTVETILDIINPELLTRKMKLPNGATISASQYIQEILFPLLPRNGHVILANNSILSIKQFIEECIMFECQEKYNGDISKYMLENTKSNFGIITIDADNGKKEIGTEELSSYINPSLLEEKVRLENGSTISKRQYIEEILAPHIPFNGLVTLEDGSNISVIKFIEEKLFSGSTPDLFKSMKNNKGLIINEEEQIKTELEEIKKHKMR